MAMPRFARLSPWTTARPYLSVAKFYSPSGKAIQDTGVTPTVLVTEAEPFVDTEEGQDAPQPPEQPRKDEDDLLLKKAIEVLTKGKASRDTQVAAKPRSALGRRNPLTNKQ